MKIKVVRPEVTGYEATIGKMYVDGVFECYTLEDCDRRLEDGKSVKVDKFTAIPRGKFNVIVTPSNRFQRNLPEILNVPGFTGVRIHAGNKTGDTEGCILVGCTVINAHFIGQSQIAFGKLFGKICATLDDHNTVELEIV